MLSVWDKSPGAIVAKVKQRECSHLLVISTRDFDIALRRPRRNGIQKSTSLSTRSGGISCQVTTFSTPFSRTPRTRALGSQSIRLAMLSAAPRPSSP